MCDGSKQNKNVPNGMIMGLRIVSKEVSSRSISNTFCKQEPKRCWIQSLQDWLSNENDAPSHYQIDCKRESRPTAKSEDFIKSSDQHNYPLQREHRPAKPSAYNSNKNRCVAAGYHHIDADVVALAQSVLHSALSHPMINGAAEKHEEHAEKKANDSESHLPANIGSEPHQPDGAQSKDCSTKVRPSVAKLSLNGPKPSRLHLVSDESNLRKNRFPRA